MKLKRFLAVLTGMVMLFAFPAAAAEEEANMVKNGGFEQGLENWETTGTVTAAAEAAYSEESGAVLSGAGSVYQTVEVPAGKTVLVSAWVRVAEGASATSDGVRLTARFNELDGSPVVGVTGYTVNSTWTKLTARGTADTAATLYVRLQTRGGAEVYVDDVEVIEQEAAIAEGEFFTMDMWSKQGILTLVQEEGRGTVANFTTDYDPGALSQEIHGLRPNTDYYVLVDVKSTVDTAAGVTVDNISGTTSVVKASKTFASTGGEWVTQCVKFYTRNYTGTLPAKLLLTCAKDQTVCFDNVRIVLVTDHIYNGDFEYGTGDMGLLKEGAIDVQIKTDDKVSGNRSVLLTMTGEGTGALYAETEQSSHLVANKAYEVSVYVKPVQENTVVQLFLEAKKNDGGWTDNPDFYATKTYENLPLNEWSKISFGYVNDAYQARIFTKLRLVGAGSAYFDGFSMKEITESSLSFDSTMGGYVLDEVAAGGVTVGGRYLSKAVDTESVMLIAAVYGEKNNAAYVADVAVAPVKTVAAGAYVDFTASVTVPGDGGAYTVKAFLWNSTTGLRPLVADTLQ